MKCLSENLIATGDDNGQVKVWDIRTRKVARKWTEHVDFISDIVYVAEKDTLVVTSGDGCLSVYDTRKNKPIAVSENQDDELLSIQIVRVSVFN